MAILAVEQKADRYRLVIACSVFVAVLWVTAVRTEPFSDFHYYHQLASQIALGGPWGDTYTAVGYPIFLAFFYWLFGAALWVPKGLNLVLFLLNDLLALRLLHHLRISEQQRKRMFLTFAFFPINIYYTSIVGTETFFTTLLLLALLVYSGNLRHKYSLLGAVVGIGSMVKPFFPAFVAVILLTDLLTGERLLTALRNASVVFLVCVLVIAPWLYRNYLLVGEFTYVSNNGGIVLYINNNSQNTFGGWMPATDVEESLVDTAEYQMANMTERNRMLSQAAKQWIRTHPREFCVLGWKRLQRTFLLSNDINYSFYGTGIPAVIQGILNVAVELVRLPLYLIGLLAVIMTSLRYVTRLLTRGRALLSKLEVCLLLAFWMFAAVYFITEGQSRYALPTVFILGYFAWRLLEAVRRRLLVANWLRNRKPA